jgi:23S rRNA (uracil1939-C5)-methyltransferase
MSEENRRKTQGNKMHTKHASNTGDRRTTAGSYGKGSRTGASVKSSTSSSNFSTNKPGKTAEYTRNSSVSGEVRRRSKDTEFDNFDSKDWYSELERLTKAKNSGKSDRSSKAASVGRSASNTSRSSTAGRYSKADGNMKDMNKSKSNHHSYTERSVKKDGSGFAKKAFEADNTKYNSRTVADSSSRPRTGRKSNIPQGSCPHNRECGGCNIMRQTYEAHLSEKQKMVEKLISKYCKVEPITGMKEPNHYRNKVHVVFDHDRRGNAISGVYEEGTHRVIPVEQCLIHNKKADAIIATIRGMLKSFKILTYDEDTGYGLLRHVLIRTGFHSGEIMVVLVLGSPILPSKNNFVKALRKEHPEITTVVVNVNDKKTSMVLGDKEQVIYGKGYIEDILCDKTFRISPKSFCQVNPLQTEVLYRKAIDMATLKGEETVIDAYCGIGTIGLIASDHVKKVIGVELNKDAVRDAVTNAKRNDAKNIEFYNNDAGEFMSQMAEQKETVDVVFMDPPRSGSSEKFMDAVVALKPKKVVYISCNPETLERDLQYITKKGYKAERAIPVDMFPWTWHVETVVLMSRVDK